MASIGSKIASALGVNIAGGQLVFNDQQIGTAQNMVRQMLTASGKTSGKSLTSMHQNFQIFGIPILEIYGLRVGVAISAFAALFLLLGWKLRGKNARSFRR